MGWSTNEADVKRKTAMKFLIPMKFDVTRAINLYKAHEVNRTNHYEIQILSFQS